MAEDRDQILNVIIRHDEMVAQRTAAYLLKHQEQIATITQNYQRMSTAGQQVAKTAMPEMQSSLAVGTDAVKKLNQTLDETPKIASKINLEGLRRTGAALSQIGLGSIGEPVRMVGDVAQIGRGLREMGDAARTLPAMISTTTVAIGGMEIALTPLLAVLAPVALALGAAALAFKLIDDQANKAADDAKKAYDELKAQWDQQEKNRQLAQTLTTEQNEQNIKITAADIKAANDHLLMLQAEKKQTDDAYAALGSSFNPGERDRLSKLGAQQQKDIDDYMQHVIELQKQFNNQTTALPPLIKAHEDLTTQADAEKKALEARDQIAEKGIQWAQQKAQQIGAGSSQSIESTLVSIKAEKDAIYNALAEGIISDEEAGKLKTRLADLNQQEEDYTNTILPAVRARETETEAIKLNKKAIEDAAKEQQAFIQAWIQRVQAVRESDNQLKDGLQKAADDRKEALLGSENALTEGLKQAQETRAEAEATAAANRAKALDAADVEQQKAELTATQKYYQENQQALVAYYKDNTQLAERARLDALSSEENFDLRMQELTSNRDVAGAIAAMKARQLELLQKQRQEVQDAKERDGAFRAAQDQRDTAYQAELKQARTAAKERRDEAQVAYDEQMQDAMTTYAKQFSQLQDKHNLETAEIEASNTKQVNALRAKHQAEQTEIDRAFAMQLAQMSGNYGGLNAMQAAYYAQMNAEALNFVNTQRGYLQSLYSGATGGAATPYANAMPMGTVLQAGSSVIFNANQAAASAYQSGGSGATAWHSSGGVVHSSFDNGGVVPYDMIAKVRKGEVVLTPEQMRGGGGGNINITVSYPNLVVKELATLKDVEAAGRAVGKAIVSALQSGAYGG